MERKESEREASGGVHTANTIGGLPAVIAAWLLAAVVAGCAAAPLPPGEKALTVAAASDLQFAFAEIGRLFERETGARVVFTFGSSGNLAKQVENGAPVDVFASADEGYIQRLAAGGFVLRDTVQLYALGRIVLVAFDRPDLRLARLDDLLRPEVRRLSLANPDHAPYGRAAKEALSAAGLWEQLKPRMVYGENVRQALQFVQTGNAEAGMVALSIADVQEVVRLPVDDALYRPLRQSLAVVKGTRQEQLARAFAAFVNGPQGRPVMERYGFQLPAEERK